MGYYSLISEEHPSFPFLLDLLWDKGFALCYKDTFNAAYSAGTNNLTRAGLGTCLGSSWLRTSLPRSTCSSLTHVTSSALKKRCVRPITYSSLIFTLALKP